VNYFLPTILDPLGELDANRNFAGKPIQPDQSPYEPKVTPSSNLLPVGQPDREGRVRHDEQGDRRRRGSARPCQRQPECAAIPVRLFHGVGRPILSAMVPVSPFSVTTRLSDIPVVNRVVGDKPVWYDKSAMYARLDDIEQRLGYAKDYHKAGDAMASASSSAATAPSSRKWCRWRSGLARRCRRSARPAARSMSRTTAASWTIAPTRPGQGPDRRG
jgi:hypothetical protein